MLKRMIATLVGMTGGAVMAAAAYASSVAPPLPATTPYKSATPMRVIIVHDVSSDCASNCSDWISAEGDIIESTRGEFQRVFKKLGNRNLPIFINSGGGSVQAALDIGREIRARKLDVAVAKTVLSPCQPGSKFCVNNQPIDGSPALIDERFSACASACTMILAAGTRRYVPISAHIGVHQLWEFKTFVRRVYRITRRLEQGVPVEVSRKLVSERSAPDKTQQGEATDRDYKPVMSYFKAMGIDGSIQALMLSTPHTSIRWMTLGELDSTHLETDQESGARLLMRLSSAQAAPAATASLADSLAARFPSARGEVVLDLFLRPKSKMDITFVFEPQQKFIFAWFQARSGDVAMNMAQITPYIEWAGVDRKYAATHPAAAAAGAPPIAAIPVADFCDANRTRAKIFDVGVTEVVNVPNATSVVLDMSGSDDMRKITAAACKV